MPFVRVGSLRYFKFPLLDQHPLKQAIFSRTGGESEAPWDSLNVGGTVGDDPHHVSRNIRRIFDSLALDPSSSHDVWQVHSASVEVVEGPRGNRPIRQADIMVTDKPGVALFMRFADCVPIFLYDPRAHAVALAHAGWRGLLANAPGKAVRALSTTYGSDPGDILAGIGPSICVDCYPVGPDVIEPVEQAFDHTLANHLVEIGNSVHLDLWGAVRTLLEAEGVGEIENSSICTAKNLQDWYSHRGEQGKTGRFAAVLALENNA